MVSSVTSFGLGPGSALPLSGPNGRSAEAGRARGAPEAEANPAVRSAPEAAWRGALAQAREARGAIDIAVGGGRQALEVLTELRDLARLAVAAPPEARAAPEQTARGLLQRYDQLIGGAVEAGARLLAGEGVAAAVDPAGGSLAVEGLDLRRGAGAVRLTDAEPLLTPAFADAAQEAVSRTQAAVGRWAEAGERLRQHQEVLTLAQAGGASGVATDLGGEGARLLALQVRQALLADPAATLGAQGSILGLFRG